MSRATIIAKIRRQKAEIDEMVAELLEEGINPEVVKLLHRLKADADTLIEALMDKSLIPRDQEELDVEPEIKKLGKKIERAKEGVERIRKLEKEKEKLEKEIKKELEGEE